MNRIDSRRIRAALAAGWSIALAFAPGVSAQTPAREVPLRLDEAEARALGGNAELSAAEARERGAAARARAARAFVWPSVEASAGFVRTDDPVGVFGTKLRQERFGEADFALPALNDPDAVSDWTAGVGTVWGVGDPARWAEGRAAEAMVDVAEARRDRTAEGVILRTRLIYLRAVAAREGRAAVAAEVEAARETGDRVARRVVEGLATEADGLRAAAAVADARARLRLAEAAWADALSELGVHLGWSPDSIPVPAPGLPEIVDRTADDPMGAARADLRASSSGVEAAQARADALGAQRLPSLEAFGQLGTHAAGLTEDRAANWTVGVRVSVPLFTGFGLSAGQAAAREEARAVEVEHRERLLRADAEVAAARRGVEAARDARDAARAAHEAAREAARLLGLRYEEGMATVADLLQAQSQAAGFDARRVEAEARWRMALAQLDFVLGTAPGASPDERTDSPQGEDR